MILAEIAIYYLIAINFLAFAAFGFDKAQAENGGWRVRENTLLTFVMFGGIGGAQAGRVLFRHKTRKSRFSEAMWGAALGNLFLVGAIYYLVTHLPEPRSPAEQALLEETMASGYYPGCNAVRAAGRAPLRYGEPGYRAEMDGDGDGLACEGPGF